MTQNKDQDIIEEFIATGSELTGSISGAVIGALFAGMPGAEIGGAAGPLLTNAFKKVGLEIKQRIPRSA